MSANGDGSTITLAAWQNLGFDNHSLLADALTSIFVNQATNDYQLAINSQAIDAGTNLVNSIVTIDLNQHTRPSGLGYDIGAYESNSTLSIGDISLIGFKIFPNPTSDYFSLRYDKTQISIKVINLFDMNGKLVKSFKSTDTLNVSGLSSGLYSFYILLTDNTLFQKKVIIY